MNILLLTQVVPFPPDSGPKIKTYHLLRYLASRHRVTLVTFTRDEREERDAAVLRETCAAVHTIHLKRSRVQDVLALDEHARMNIPASGENNWSWRLLTSDERWSRCLGAVSRFALLQMN